MILEIKQKFDEMPVPKYRYYNVFSIEQWKFAREYSLLPQANWTDEELNNYDKKTGLIGTKCSVECFVTLGTI